MARKSIGQEKISPALEASNARATVIDMAAFKNRDTVAALTELLQRALQGQLLGLAFIYKTRRKRHGIGLTGDYCDDPSEALAGASRMLYKANQLMSARADEPDTESMPL